MILPAGNMRSRRLFTKFDSRATYVGQFPSNQVGNFVYILSPSCGPCRLRRQMTTVLLVDDDPLQAHVRRTILGRASLPVERAADAAEAFILVEDPEFTRRLSLVVVGLGRPGMGSRVVVDELTSRVPLVPILVLGPPSEEACYSEAPHVRFLPRTASSEQLLAVSREMVEKYTPTWHNTGINRPESAPSRL